jgi:glycosyltransferase involved in cell wall biosynthesis
MNKNELTILMPCLNEAETIGTCIKKASDWMLLSGIDGEIVIADNGSADGSQEIARYLGARVIDVPVRGYGAALTAGIKRAKGKYVIMGDCDDSYDFSNLDLFVRDLRSGAELVVGNRFKGRLIKGAMPFLHRYLGNPVLSFLGRVFFRTPINDFHCGLRGINKEAILSLSLQTTGMEFASEMIVKASLFKLRISEVPVTLFPDGRSRPPHLRTWRDGWRHLRFLLMYSPTWLFMVPGLFFIIAGFALMLLTIAKPFELMKGVFIDTNTLVYSSVFIILGYSAVSLSLFTRTFATEEGFLPKTKNDKKFEGIFSLEFGLIAGLIMLMIGLFISGYMIYLWKNSGFGRLDFAKTLRLVVPASTFILMGIQTIFSSFFISILKIKTKNRDVFGQDLTINSNQESRKLHFAG